MDIVTVSCATSIIEGLEFYCDRIGLTSGRVGLILRAVGALQAIFADKKITISASRKNPDEVILFDFLKE